MGSPLLLDACACQGAATEGYQRAGFRVHAVDTEARHEKWNPAEKFIQADALEYIAAMGHMYDAIHVSPPCQWYTRGNAPRRGTETRWHRTIPEFREVLESTGRPYVIENVKDAGWDMKAPTTLCGCMFRLMVRDYTCGGKDHAERLTHLLAAACDRWYGVEVYLQRPRLFETSGFTLTAPAPCDHTHHKWVGGVYSGARRDKYEAKFIRKGGYVPPDKDLAAALLGIGLDHAMTWEGLAECVPPAYTHHIGNQLLEVLGER